MTLALSALAQQKPADAQAKPMDQTPAAAMPTADQIIDKYVQAIGGKAAVEKITSRSAKGTFDMPAMGVNTPVETYSKAPNKSVFILDIPGFGMVREGYDGTVAWAQDPQLGMREKTGVELAQMKLASEFHRDVKLKQLFPKMVVKGKEKVGEREAYVIEATPAEGGPEKWYFDTQTGLLLRQDMEAENPQGKVPVTVIFEDYRDVDGVKIPFVLHQSNPAISFTIKFTEIKHNVPIDDAKFNKPAAQ